MEKCPFRCVTVVSSCVIAGCFLFLNRAYGFSTQQKLSAWFFNDLLARRYSQSFVLPWHASFLSTRFPQLALKFFKIILKILKSTVHLYSNIVFSFLETVLSETLKENKNSPLLDFQNRLLGPVPPNPARGILETNTGSLLGEVLKAIPELTSINLLVIPRSPQRSQLGFCKLLLNFILSSFQTSSSPPY